MFTEGWNGAHFAVDITTGLPLQVRQLRERTITGNAAGIILIRRATRIDRGRAASLAARLRRPDTRVR